MTAQKATPARAHGTQTDTPTCTHTQARRSAGTDTHTYRYYFSFDLDYAVRQYGAPDASGTVAVIVCNVVVGNLYPAIELPASQGGDVARSLEGRPGVPKYDAHGALVDFHGGCLPCPPASWGARTMYSELVLFDTASILPRCVIAVTPPAFP